MFPTLTARDYKIFFSLIVKVTNIPHCPTFQANTSLALTSSGTPGRLDGPWAVVGTSPVASASTSAALGGAIVQILTPPPPGRAVTRPATCGRSAFASRARYEPQAAGQLSNR